MRNTGDPRRKTACVSHMFELPRRVHLDEYDWLLLIKPVEISQSVQISRVPPEFTCFDNCLYFEINSTMPHILDER